MIMKSLMILIHGILIISNNKVKYLVFFIIEKRDDLNERLILLGLQNFTKKVKKFCH